MYLISLLSFTFAFAGVAIAKIPPPPCSDCTNIGAKRCHYENFQRLVQECKYDAKVAHGCWKLFQSCGLCTSKSQFVKFMQGRADITTGTEDGGAHCWEN